MSDLMLPPSLPIARIVWKYLYAGGSTSSPYTGAVRTRDLGGDRWACTIDFAIAKESDRASLLAFVGSLRGMSNRAIVIDPTHVPLGSFPAVELFSNSYFSNGAVGWTTDATKYVMRALSGALRLTMNTDSASPGSVFALSQNPGMAVVGVPYCVRGVIQPGRGAWSTSVIYPILDSNSQSSFVNASGYALNSLVHSGADGRFGLYDFFGTGRSAGDYFDVSFMSAARCMLADGGGNLMLQSNDITNPAWTKGSSTATANQHRATDGAITADKLTENSANAQHYILQSVTRTAGAADISAYGFFGRSTGTRDVRLVAGNDLSTSYAYCIFDLGAGSAGVTTVVGTATNARAFIANMGNGMYFCVLIVRCPSATTVAMEVDMVNAGATTYLGNGTSALVVDQVGCCISGVPTRGSKTTAAAALPSSQKGSTIFVKGLPASTNNLLRVNDWVEVTAGARMFKRQVINPLDSDAAGLGVLTVSPPMQFDVADNAPIIVCKPAARMVCVSDPPEWLTEPGVYSTVSLDFIESGD